MSRAFYNFKGLLKSMKEECEEKIKEHSIELEKQSALLDKLMLLDQEMTDKYEVVREPIKKQWQDPKMFEFEIPKFEIPKVTCNSKSDLIGKYSSAFCNNEIREEINSSVKKELDIDLDVNIAHAKEVSSNSMHEEPVIRKKLNVENTEV